MSRLKIEPDFIKYTVQKMKNKMMSEDVFDTVQARVSQISILVFLNNYSFNYFGYICEKAVVFSLFLC